MTINQFRTAVSGIQKRYRVAIGPAVRAYLAEVEDDLARKHRPQPDEANNQPPRLGLRHEGRRHTWWERFFGSKWLSWPALRWPNRKPPTPLRRNVVYSTVRNPLRAWAGVRNSESMEKSWVIEWDETKLIGRLGNPASYAPYCHGDEERTVVMQRRGWPSVGEAQERAQDLLDTEITSMVDRTIGLRTA